jgi:uncharacterized protein YjbI with pentapeptide repeats
VPDHRAASGKRTKVREPAAPDIPGNLTTASMPDAELDEDTQHIGLAVSDLDLSGRDAGGAELDQCRYDNVGFGAVGFRRATIRDVEFIRCDLANLRARDSSVLRVAVSGSRMTGATFLACTLRDTTFTGCRIDLASFAGSKFRDVTYTNCRLDQVNFIDADLSGVRFHDCDLTRAQFLGATLAGTRFVGCDLTGITGVTSMRGAIITSSDALTLARILAESLGITIDDDEQPGP